MTAARLPPIQLSPDHPALRPVETPALVVGGAALDTNIARMAETARQHGVHLRPHAKTHKSNEIARRQLAAGAIGITCATILEAEDLSAAGSDGLLISAPMMGGPKFARVARLNRQRRLMLGVDHAAQVEELVQQIAAGDPPLGVLVDIDVGQRRTGVVTPAEAVALARLIATHRGLEFAGVQGYAGHAQHITAPAERRAAASASARVLSGAVEALRKAGLPARIVSGSGTGAHLYDATGPYTELQVGSYVFMDSEYARVVDDSGAAPRFDPSLFVLATVVSVNRAGSITVDAGTKALAVNGPAPCHLAGVPAGSSYRFGGDEHGIIDLPAGASPPPLGARVLIGATHCDPTVNLHAALHVVRAGTADDGGGLEVWPVLGRYRAGRPDT